MAEVRNYWLESELVTVRFTPERQRAGKMEEKVHEFIHSLLPAKTHLCGITIYQTPIFVLPFLPDILRRRKVLISYKQGQDDCFGPGGEAHTPSHIQSSTKIGMGNLDK